MKIFGLLLLCGLYGQGAAMAAASTSSVTPVPSANLFFKSGLMRDFVDNQGGGSGRERRAESAALEAFLGEHFGAFAPDFQWKEQEVIRDRHYAHHLYALYYLGRRVDGAFLRAHYRRDGWIDYASSTWEAPFTARASHDGEGTRRRIEADIKRRYLARFGYFDGKISTEPVYWVSPVTGEAIAALDIQVSAYRPMSFEHFLVDEGSGRVLARRPVARQLNQSVYLVSPFAGNNTNPMLQNQALPLLQSSTQLLNQFLYVRRENGPPTTSCNYTCLEDVSPQFDFVTNPPHTGASAPLSYDDTCSGASTTSSCPDQSFDAVNVYYQISTYRQNLQPYFDRIGASPTASRDPINVVIMAFNENVSNLTPPVPADEINNAAFIPRPCNVAEGDGTTNQVCLVFLRPASVIQSTNCNSSPAVLFDVAREAIVAVHEYTHYITDSQTHMVGQDDASDPRLWVVGDALHEGYSDYFAASEVSYLNQTVGLGSPGGGTGTDVTLVGQYAFQNCPSFQRDVSVLTPFDYTSQANADKYQVSLTWSSGLWNLRQQFGKDIVDAIVLQSQLFLTPRPGFLEAVESLVHADETLNGGSHVSAIRNLFYGQLHFYGAGDANAFQDLNNGIMDVGFHSCNAVTWTSRPYAPLLALLAWLQAVLWLGRAQRRRSRS